MAIFDLALEFTPGLGTRGIAHLMECYGSAEEVFAASEQELTARAELRPAVAKSIVQREGMTRARIEAEYCKREGIDIIAATHEEYPPLLREVSDNPHIIYKVGQSEALSGPCLSIVGTREFSPYGERMCGYLIRELAERIPDLVIVSGLAFGIDSICHRQAMACGLRTVAVIANPLPKITPSQHTHLAREIVDTGGAIITELHSQTHQRGNLYIPRNRIIAALSEGTLLIESPATGGSLSTVQFADSYNRTVMALPGRIGDRTAQGPNTLIRNRRAQMVLSADDIIKELMWDIRLEGIRDKKGGEQITLTGEEAELFAYFEGDDPLTTAQLLELSGLDMPTLNALLISLELAGVVHQLPGNRYEKVTR